MTDLEIKYHPKQARTGLILGLAFLALGIVSLIGERPLYFPFGASLVYIVMFFYRRHVSYLTVKDGILKKDMGAKIPITDIIETKIFAGEYTFRSRTAKIVIDKNAVSPDSVHDLEMLMDKVRLVVPNSSLA